MIALKGRLEVKDGCWIDGEIVSIMKSKLKLTFTIFRDT